MDKKRVTLPLDPDKSSRQSALLNANAIIHPDKFEIVRGKYINKTIMCPHCHFLKSISFFVCFF